VLPVASGAILAHDGERIWWKEFVNNKDLLPKNNIFMSWK